MHVPPTRKANCRDQGLIKQPMPQPRLIVTSSYKHCVIRKWPRPFTHCLSLFSSSNGRDIATETIQAAKPKIFTICSFTEKFAEAWSVSRRTCGWTLGLIQHFPRELWTSRYRVMDEAADLRTRPWPGSYRSEMNAQSCCLADTQLWQFTEPLSLGFPNC